MMQSEPTAQHAREPPNFARDVGVLCRHPVTGEEDYPRYPVDNSFEINPLNAHGYDDDGCFEDNQDNFACVQVDDAKAAWGMYAVADGHGPHGHLISTLLVHELPGVLAQNPNLYSHSSMALHQAFLAVGEMASSCQFVDASASGGTLSAVLLRDGFLHVSWVGDSKVVLGRFTARPAQNQGQAEAEGEGLLHALPQGPPQWPQAPRAAQAAQAARPASPPAQQAQAWRHAYGAASTGRTAHDGARGLVQHGAKEPPTRASTQQTLRAVELTCDDAPRAARKGSQSARDAAKSAHVDRGWADSADGAGGPPAQLKPSSRSFGDVGRHDAPCFGSSSTSYGVSSAPEVRRMRLKPEDVFVVLGTAGLWKRLGPADVVAIVGQNLHLMAADVAHVLAAHAEQVRVAGNDDITVMVVYLNGDRHVNEFDKRRASHLPERRGLVVSEGNDLAGLPCDGCMPRFSRELGPF